MFLSFNNDTKNGFENKKWNYTNRKCNHFSYFLLPVKKLLLHNFSDTTSPTQPNLHNQTITTFVGRQPLMEDLKSMGKGTEFLDP